MNKESSIKIVTQFNSLAPASSRASWLILNLTLTLFVILFLFLFQLNQFTPLVTKVKVSGVDLYTSDIKQSLSLYFMQTGNWPRARTISEKSESESSPDYTAYFAPSITGQIESIVLDSNGGIHAYLEKQLTRQINQLINSPLETVRVLSIRPAVSALQNIFWTCGYASTVAHYETKAKNRTNIPPQFLTHNCK